MTEELDLDQLFKRFIRFIFRNRRFLLMFVIIISVMVCFYYTLIRPPHYKSTAICTSKIAKFEQRGEFQRAAVDLVNYLQIFIDAKDPQGLANLLSVDYEVAATFSNIEAIQLYQLDLNEEYKNIDKFEINLVLTSNKYYDEIEKGFIYYFNNNQFLIDISSAYVDSKQKVYDDMVDEINKLQEERARTPNKQTGDFINTEVTGHTAVNEIIYLSQKRESTLRDIKTSKIFSYVQSFSKVNIPQNDIWLWISLSILLSFILGLFIALIRESI